MTTAIHVRGLAAAALLCASALASGAERCKLADYRTLPAYRPAIGIAYCKEALRRFERLPPDERKVHDKQIARIKERLR